MKENLHHIYTTLVVPALVVAVVVVVVLVVLYDFINIISIFLILVNKIEFE